MKTKTPLAQIQDLIELILCEMNGLSKPQLGFMRWIFIAWLGFPVRRNMTNLARFGPYCEKTIRSAFSRGFCFVDFNARLIDRSCGGEKILVFDPSYIRKSGKKTYGANYWWSGMAQRVVWGLELGVVAVIDVSSRQGFSFHAVQTPCLKELEAAGKNLMTHYISIITDQGQRLKKLGIGYIAADAYFAKQNFMDAIVQMEMHLITRARTDANLKYLYNGPQKKTGRRKVYDGKVDCKKIDKRRIRQFHEDDLCTYYSGIVYAAACKRNVRIVYMQSKKTGEHVILLCSDVKLAPEKILDYYRLRFQIEFLIRDAKGHAGLEECQARSKEKLNFHFNMALSSVSIAKAATWLSRPQPERKAFSMRNINIFFTCQLFTKRVFQNLGLDLSCKKHQEAYYNCLDVERLIV